MPMSRGRRDRPQHGSDGDGHDQGLDHPRDRRMIFVRTWREWRSPSPASGESGPAVPVQCRLRAGRDRHTHDERDGPCHDADDDDRQCRSLAQLRHRQRTPGSAGGGEPTAPGTDRNDGPEFARDDLIPAKRCRRAVNGGKQGVARSGRPGCVLARGRAEPVRGCPPPWGGSGLGRPL